MIQEDLATAYDQNVIINLDGTKTHGVILTVTNR